MAPYFKGEGMNQKSENMWSFQMTPSNLRNVIFMCAKYFHGEMALQRNVLFLGLPVYNIVDRKIIPFPIFGGPLHLAPYFKREGINQKSENMWSF